MNKEPAFFTRELAPRKRLRKERGTPGAGHDSLPTGHLEKKKKGVLETAREGGKGGRELSPRQEKQTTRHLRKKKGQYPSFKGAGRGERHLIIDWERERILRSSKGQDLA